MDDMTQCEAFAHRWLITISREMAELAEAGILPDGKLRELAGMYRRIEWLKSTDHLMMAERAHHRAAIKFLATLNWRTE